LVCSASNEGSGRAIGILERTVGRGVSAREQVDGIARILCANSQWRGAAAVQDKATKHHIPHRREIFKKEEGAEAP
jgi:hypothetical protein